MLFRSNDTATTEIYTLSHTTLFRSEVEADNYYRPRDQKILAAHASIFPNIKLYSIDADFGGWQKAQATHFADGGVFDQIYKPGK